MFNVIDAQSTFTAVGRFQAYPVLMSLQQLRNPTKFSENSRSSIFVSIERACDFLLVINSNLGHIFYHF